MPENYSMPTPPDPDGPTAWLRGDLPADPENRPAELPGEAIAEGTAATTEPPPAEADEASTPLAETLAELGDLAEMYDLMAEPVLDSPLDVEVVLAAGEPAEAA